MPNDSGAAVIAARSLSYRYPGSLRPALQGLDLQVQPGEYLAVLGANGSGKSTLLKLLVGLLVPESGTLAVCGSVEHDSFRRCVSVVLQNPDDQIVATVAEEDVAFGPENLGLPRAEIDRRVAEALAAVGLTESRRKPPHFLSGGERQRLALAGALAMEAPVLALDEAVSMIDPLLRASFLDLLDVFSQRGKTILHVTHSMEDAFRASRVLVLHQGVLVFDGTPADLFDRPELEAWGLEPPQTVLCVRELRRLGLGLSPRLLDPADFADAVAEVLSKRKAAEAMDADDSMSGPGDSGASSMPGTSRAGAALRLENVSHTYLTGTDFASAALRGVDLAVSQGQSLALVGPSGCGKSTLLRHGNAVLLPGEGRALVFGQDTLDPDVPLRPLRTRAALAVQSPESALFSRYVADDVAYGPRNKGLSGKALVSAVRGAMEQAGLPYSEYRDRETVSLSGGEKRKAALAGVFALGAELYLLDEPSAALDPVSRRQLLARLLKLPGEGIALVATTHSMEEAALFDRVAVMREGRIAAEGPPREIFYDRFDEAWGIGLPWAAAAVRELSIRGIPVAGRPMDALELAQSLAGAASAAGPAFQPEAAVLPGAGLAVPERPARRGTRRGAGIEFFRNAVLGQFLDRPSPVRNLGPMAKYAALVVLLALSAAGGSILLPLVALAVTLAIGAVARVGPRHLLRGTVPALPYLALIAAFQLGFSWPGDASAVLAGIGPVSVTVLEVRRAALLVVRFFALMAELSLFSAVTPLSEAVGGIRTALGPLARIGFPVRDLAMIAAVALRFVPVLAEEGERIATAQLSRGGGYSGKRRVRAGIALTVPLFLRSLERAEALAVAMELRLYGDDRRK
jgi:energy-coupling factor transport system ATP-binding protein